MKMRDIHEDFDDDDIRAMQKVGIDPADQDDDGEEFKAKRMFDQLGKVIDSRGNPNPLTTVTTDDGDEVEVSPQEAHMIRGLEMRTSQQGGQKEKFMRMIQTTDGLNKVLDMIRAQN
jgi:hypothetical protein